MSEPVPDVIGEVVGYRAWRVLPAWPETYELFSIYDEMAWPEGAWAVAECDGDAEGIPHEHHHCGIYAARDRAHLIRLRYNEIQGTAIAIGEVALSGDVIPATRGWRAEKARPIRLWLPYEHWELVRPLRARYRIPVGLSNILRKGASNEHRT